MAAVTLQSRDVTFTFTDSCNCCYLFSCCRRKHTIDDHVYVNSRGKLEAFNASKAKKDIDEAFNRSKTHLFENLKKRLLMIKGNPEDFYFRSKGILASIDALGKIKMTHINSINDLVLEHLNALNGDK